MHYSPVDGIENRQGILETSRRRKYQKSEVLISASDFYEGSSRLLAISGRAGSHDMKSGCTVPTVTIIAVRYVSDDGFSEGSLANTCSFVTPNSAHPNSAQP